MRMDEVEPKRLPETSAYVAEEEKVKAAKAAKEKADLEKAAAKLKLKQTNGGDSEGNDGVALHPGLKSRAESMKRRKLHWETIPKERLSKRRESIWHITPSAKAKGTSPTPGGAGGAGADGSGDAKGADVDDGAEAHAHRSVDFDDFERLFVAEASPAGGAKERKSAKVCYKRRYSVLSSARPTPPNPHPPTIPRRSRRRKPLGL